MKEENRTEVLLEGDTETNFTVLCASLSPESTSFGRNP